MKCLVSGATGFIGRQLCQQLAAGGHTIIALSKNGRRVAVGAPFGGIRNFGYVCIYTRLAVWVEDGCVEFPNSGGYQMTAPRFGSSVSPENLQE